MTNTERRDQLEEIKKAVLAVPGGGTEACMAAALEVMLLHVAPQTFYRPIALFLMEQSRDSDRPLTRADFPFIDAYVWDRRIGHTLTMLDAKVLTSYFLLLASDFSLLTSHFSLLTLYFA